MSKCKCMNLHVNNYTCIDYCHAYVCVCVRTCRYLNKYVRFFLESGDAVLG